MSKQRRWRWLKRLVGLVLILGTAGFGGWYYLQQGDNGPPEYQTVTVSRGPLAQVVTANGQLNPVVKVQVGSQISGTIDKLFADFNSKVKEGQVIAQIDAATYDAAVQNAEADLAKAQSALELAEVNFTRAKSLRAENLIPQSDFDKARADVHEAAALAKISQANLAKAKVDLARCTIRSPIDGIVIMRSVDVGQTVAASLNAPTLFVIANDLSKMQIEAKVAEGDIGVVDLGQEVDFTVDAFPSQIFHGRIMQIRNSPSVDQNVVSYDTIIEVNNPKLKLKPGMTANVSIIVARREEALKIPNAALRFRPPATTPKKSAGLFAAADSSGKSKKKSSG
ncbi:MAG TPA: efflux RND transporter periplasmic adaptor subunit, partial [Verrucomicrobiae bacterium]|nr:efflux RND transporter periplasmic adaptor subunit [Verrucomicrobiae bacterium]